MTLADVNVVQDYHPWSAEFSDGTYLSRLHNPSLTFEPVAAKLALLFTFYIHYDWHQVVAVRLSDGLFYKGRQLGSVKDWTPHPAHLPYQKYTLCYSRQCSGAFCDGKILASCTGYTLGWTTEVQGKQEQRVMKLDLCGDHTWA